ncbi:hypothetical protein RHCRD62_50003 [Rhodococcus sp. RD6.2]|nr:hypothetical protein RHCRD62_50003 [Rhodococcus sp. RD6.2]
MMEECRWIAFFLQLFHGRWLPRSVGGAAYLLTEGGAQVACLGQRVTSHHTTDLRLLRQQDMCPPDRRTAGLVDGQPSGRQVTKSSPT